MKEFVLVEFMVLIPEEAIILASKLKALGDDFMPIINDDDREFEIDEDGEERLFFRVAGRISSEYASLIKLQDPFLSDRMRISYIPEDLKDRYRK